MKFFKTRYFVENFLCNYNSRGLTGARDFRDELIKEIEEIYNVMEKRYSYRNPNDRFVIIDKYEIEEIIRILDEKD